MQRHQTITIDFLHLSINKTLGKALNDLNEHFTELLPHHQIFNLTNSYYFLIVSRESKV